MNVSMRNSSRKHALLLLVLALGACRTAGASDDLDYGKARALVRESAKARKAAMLPKASSSTVDGLPVVRLAGTPYEIGFQHGFLLRDRVQENYANALGFLAQASSASKVDLLARLDGAWSELAPFVPADYLEEMRGLSAGSGVSLDKIHRLHAVPDVFSTECSLGAFYGPATADGRLYMLRNLDWDRRFGVHKNGAVFVISPAGKHAFVNLGIAGFVGTLSGMNDAGISVGQVGSSSSDESHQGTSFVFLLRRILEEAGTADQGASVVSGARRTVGINYVIGSALEKKALALETTAGHIAQFRDDDPGEAASPYARPIKGAVFRADTAFDAAVRHLQTASNGDPKQATPPDPHGSDPYDIRYLGQADYFQADANHNPTRRISLAKGQDGAPADMLAIAKKIAPGSNIQSAVFAFPDFWISYAQGNAPAADGPYHHFNLQVLLK